MLRAADYRRALNLIQQVAEADAGDFAWRGVELLSALVASEITTLSICHLASGRREVISTPRRTLGAEELAAFDRHFSTHPLVRYHGYLGGRRTQRISDCVAFGRFRESALYHDYYRPVGIDHAIAVPMQVDDGLLVSFVLNRRRRDFDDRERDLLQAINRPLAALYHQSTVVRQLRGEPLRDASSSERWALTEREREVLHWLARGKADRDIAEILAISPRTVAKHLQRIYDKLGVETRTAAVLRALRGRPVSG
jgi:DNA-binding CsgD family transcriptional regulator